MMYYYHTVPQLHKRVLPDPYAQERIIKVTGEGTITAQPDQAQVTIGVITKGMSLQSIQAENDTTITAIINELTTLGIPKEKIKTSSYTINPQYDYVNGKQIPRGYEVRHLLQVTIDDINNTGLIIDSAVAQGANYVSNIDFTLSNQATIYRQSLSLAVEDAKEKAGVLAKDIAPSLEKIPVLLKINEISVPPRFLPPQPLAYAAVAAAPTPIEPGELTITSRIEAEFRVSLIGVMS
ncbi:SIMPL domain-containing protein [Desertibacillus haloalkaliphilus]|uniref:SIMPL domain-containing protein n=1 Tax=Desertibacillus haloalkaliphilus TaxID=1328930 RepID=UPI001C25FAA9|nr:SIMPL domain-containing protein [Desertibacillus haloalkaliphilus]MBU8907496.1 SIMPL domain-containing protein [Desertibacillus haloalkaliphilus]